MQDFRFEFTNNELPSVAKIVCCLANINRTNELIQLVKNHLLPLLEAYSIKWSINTTKLNEEPRNTDKKIYTVVRPSDNETSCYVIPQIVRLENDPLATINVTKNHYLESNHISHNHYQNIEYVDPLTSNELLLVFSKNCIQSEIGLRQRHILNLIQPSFMACLRSIVQHEKYSLLVNLTTYFMQKTIATCVVNHNNTILELNSACQILLGKSIGETLGDGFLGKQINRDCANLKFANSDHSDTKHFYYYANDLVYEVNVKLMKTDKTGIKIIQISAANQDVRISIKQHRELGITKKEQDILLLISTGLKSADIANCLHISINTLKTHLRHIHQKCQTKNKTQLINLFAN